MGKLNLQVEKKTSAVILERKLEENYTQRFAYEIRRTIYYHECQYCALEEWTKIEINQDMFMWSVLLKQQ